MKKIILFLFFTFSFALNFFGENEIPKWIINYKSGKNFYDTKNKYFVGISKVYIDTSDGKQKAIEDARKDAYKQISEYLGIYIKSTLNIKKSTLNGNSFKDINTNTEIRTNSFIADAKVNNIYIEKKDNKIVAYVLLKIDNDSLKKLKQKIVLDKKKYDSLKKEIIKAIKEKKLHDAKNLLVKAKTFKSSYMDDELILLENKIEYLETLPNVYILLDKHSYLANEEMIITLNMNNNGFVYLFFGKQLLFPDEYNSENYLYNNSSQELAISAHEGKLLAIASLKELNFPVNYIDDGYKFISQKDINKVIDKCLKEEYCTISTELVHIANNYSVNLNIQASNKDKIIDYLLRNGIRLDKNSSKKINCSVKQNIKHSNLYGDVITYTLKVNNQEYKNLTMDDLLKKIKEMIMK